MKTLTRDGMKQIREEVESALKQISLKLGVSLSLGSGTFRENDGSFRLKVLTTGDGNTSPEAAKWKRYCGRYGFDVSDLGKTFKSQGYEFQITGIEPSRPKYPLSAKRLFDGRGFKFPADVVLIGLKMDTPFKKGDKVLFEGELHYFGWYSSLGYCTIFENEGESGMQGSFAVKAERLTPYKE